MPFLSSDYVVEILQRCSSSQIAVPKSQSYSESSILPLEDNWLESSPMMPDVIFVNWLESSPMMPAVIFVKHQFVESNVVH
jgi:hypothetical protein